MASLLWKWKNRSGGGIPLSFCVENAVGTKFANNPLIHSFKEFVLFNGVTSLVGWWLKDYDIRTNFVEIGEFPPNLVSGADGSCWGIRGSLTIPAKMSKLGGNATFGNRAPNQGVTELIIKRSTPPTVISFGQAPFSKIYVPDDSVETYKAAPIWANKASTIRKLSDFTTDFPDSGLEEYLP